ncbi:hypothetical protein [Rhodocista pekingensis]|uniref:Peroxiredoxin family protein n=1 Tax=Rhodocista pekingensis TaxID=201185 RepID=A0ABW2KTD5_9PROT
MADGTAPPGIAPPGIALVVQSGGFDRVHYAFALAAAAAAIGRPAILFVTGRALPVLTPDPGWHSLDPADDGSPPVERERYLAERGLATLAELVESCGALGVRVIACELGWRSLGHDAAPPTRPDLRVETAGLVTLLTAAGPGWQTVFV